MYILYIGNIFGVLTIYLGFRPYAIGVCWLLPEQPVYSCCFRDWCWSLKSTEQSVGGGAGRDASNKAGGGRDNKLEAETEASGKRGNPL